MNKNKIETRHPSAHGFGGVVCVCVFRFHLQNTLRRECVATFFLFVNDSFFLLMLTGNAIKSMFESVLYVFTRTVAVFCARIEYPPPAHSTLFALLVVIAQNINQLQSPNSKKKKKQRALKRCKKRWRTISFALDFEN